jgi:uncharacterized delta-60 repeat protein
MNRYKVLITILSFFCSLLPALLYSQVDTAWVRRYNGPGNGYDEAHAIALDDVGNVYVTGYSTGSGTGSDYATIKYNSDGDTIWVQRYNGPGNNNDWAYSLAVDGQGNVYVTGYSTGSGTSYDYATIKYNSAGVEQWVQRYNGPGNDYDVANAIAVDGQGNVYVTGISRGSTTFYDYATIKYNSDGDTIWVRRYDGPGNSDDGAYSLAVDGQGNVYVTGYSVGSGIYLDYATIKYNSAGVEQWVAGYNGPGNSDDVARSLAVDGQGNVYVTGISRGSTTFYDYATIKYNSAGVEQWVQRYNGPGNGSDWAYSLAVDGQGNVYVTGYSAGTSAYPYNYDYATIKYVQTQGIEEIEIATPSARNDFVVYPNPAKTYFTVRLPKTADRSEIKIFDVNGKIVKSEELKGKNNRVSLNGIKNGVYFVQVTTPLSLRANSGGAAIPQTKTKKLIVAK